MDIKIILTLYFNHIFDLIICHAIFYLKSKVTVQSYEINRPQKKRKKAVP